MIVQQSALIRVTRHQLRASLWRVFLACLIGALLALGRCLELLSLKSAVGGQGASLGDLLALVTMGSSQPSPSPLTVSGSVMLRIPFAWLVLVLLPSVLVSLTINESAGGLVASGGRVTYWMGRCLANVVECALYWLTVIGGCVVFAALRSFDITLEVSTWLPDAAGLSKETLPMPPYDALLPLISVCSMSCALSLAQLAITEVVDARAGFVLAVSLIAGSVFSLTPALLGNFMMMARSTVFVVSHQVELLDGALRAGLSPQLGTATACALALLSVIAGTIAAARKDYLGSVQR